MCGNGKCSPGGFPASLPCQSTAILFLIQVITETTKRNKHKRQKHKKMKGEIYDTRDTRFPHGRELV
jgi:hypothetical protein